MLIAEAFGALKPLDARTLEDVLRRAVVALGQPELWQQIKSGAGGGLERGLSQGRSALQERVAVSHASRCQNGCPTSERRTRSGPRGCAALANLETGFDGLELAAVDGVFAEQLLDAKQLIVFGNAVGAAQGTGLDLAGVGGHGNVGDG